MSKKVVTSVEELKEMLTPRQCNLIFIGCLFVMMAVSGFGLSLSTIQQPMLEKMGAADQFSMVTVIASIATCMMTPVGGRLADMIGGRNVIAIAGGLCVILSVILGFCGAFWPYLIVRFLFSCAVGAFVSTPFLVVREIFPFDKVPSRMGILTAALSLGALIGSQVSGYLSSISMFLAIVFPSLFLLVGIPMIYVFLPVLKKPKSTFDFLGFVLLAASLAAIFLGINYGPKEGWGNPLVLCGLIGGVILAAVFAWWENRVSSPLISMSLFTNKRFAVLLAVAFLSFTYLNALNVYAPLGVQVLMGKTAAEAGSLQIPRTILTVLLPFVVGVWVVKKKNNLNIAMILSAILIGLPFVGLVFMGPKMPFWFVVTMVAINGIGDVFRSVSVTPIAQNQLPPTLLGSGTAMISFVTSLAGVFASALFGNVYDALRLANSGLQGEIMGLDTVFLMTAAFCLIELLIIVFVYLPMSRKSIQK